MFEMGTASSGPRIPHISPVKFYQLVDVVKKLSGHDKDLELFEEKLATLTGEMEMFAHTFARASVILAHERRLATRRNTNLFASMEKDSDDNRGGEDNFLEMGRKVTQILQEGYTNALDLTNRLRPGDFILSKKRHMELKDTEELQNLLFEVQLNQSTLDRVLYGLFTLDEADKRVNELVKEALTVFEHYFKRLTYRHSVEGIKIHRDPVMTDIALAVFENVDAHGEIEDGKNPDEMSAYSVRKAETITRTVKEPEVMLLINEPSTFTRFVINSFRILWDGLSSLQEAFTTEIRQVQDLLGTKTTIRRLSEADIMNQIAAINDLDPASVVHKDREGLLTREERFALKFRNETLENVVKMLADKYKPSNEVAKYILERKAELRRFYHEENTFYVCKIGNGNPFLGEAPGELKVIPGIRPIADLEEVVGSGFAEVKDFIQSIEETNKWHDLFLATSPSRSADKSNVLLIGPQGCGKTEILRAVGGDKDSIGIFAQGSDFLTCWKGEAEKNPKRLFESGLKLSKESDKRVHFLIDEIDAVLNNDRDLSGTNLTLEFQILMDGVVAYPNLSVWGATNNPHRIPTPMLRRFNKALIVGELGHSERITLLKHFIGEFLPLNGVTDNLWDEMATKLEGAVGDTIRKIADHIWRQKMGTFVRQQPELADKMVAELNKEGNFSIAEFDSEARAAFKRTLRPHVQVRAEDVADSVELHLKNIAIQHEIATATETYKRAHELLAQLNQ